MEQKSTIQITQEFLRSVGSGAEADEVAKLFSENLDWEIAGDTNVLPWIGKKTGRSSVIDFMNGTRELIERISFDVLDVLAGEKRSVILGSLVSKVKKTGIAFKTDFAIILTVAHGEIVRFQMLEDSFAVSKAVRG